MADEEDPVVVLEGDDDSLMLGMSAVEDSQRPLRPRRRRLKGKKVGACPPIPGVAQRPGFPVHCGLHTSNRSHPHTMLGAFSACLY
jgi:hypothetical protein